MTARKQKPTWSDLKRQLADLDRRALLGLIQDLYTASKNNQAFLHARFALGEDVLDPYKATIDRWVCPDVMRNQDISVAKCEYVRLNRPRTPSDVAGTHKLTAERALTISRPGDFASRPTRRTREPNGPSSGERRRPATCQAASRQLFGSWREPPSKSHGSS
jgi:hypothetical protein